MNFRSWTFLKYYCYFVTAISLPYLFQINQNLTTKSVTSDHYNSTNPSILDLVSYNNYLTNSWQKHSYLHTNALFRNLNICGVSSILDQFLGCFGLKFFCSRIFLRDRSRGGRWNWILVWSLGWGLEVFWQFGCVVWWGQGLKNCEWKNLNFF